VNFWHDENSDVFFSSRVALKVLPESGQFPSRTCQHTLQAVNTSPENTVFLYMQLSAGDPPPKTLYRCPCCGYRTLEEPSAMALCPVCWWEDDGQEDSDASEIRLTVNGHLSLTEARASYLRCGAADPRFLPYVRKPIGSEL
jgi:hypothetical protein